VKPAEVVVANGSNEILELLGHAFLRPGDEVVAGWPAFVVCRLVALMFGAKPVDVPLRRWAHDLDAMRAAVTDRTRLVFLATPNNPTGGANAAADVVAFARSLPPHVVFAFDEAYAEYALDPADLLPLVREGRHVVCLRTFSKVHGLAAFRLGYAICPEPLAGLLHRVRQPFNVNAVAQAAGVAAVADRAWVDLAVQRNRAGLAQLTDGLAELGVPPVPSEGNFLLAQTGSGRAVFSALQKLGVIVRPMDGYDLPDHLRVSVGTPEQNRRFLDALARVLGRS
jgi:histidinol-phosphate aminotransferase